MSVLGIAPLYRRPAPFLKILLPFLSGIMLAYGSSNPSLSEILQIVCLILLIVLGVMKCGYLHLEVYRNKWLPGALFFLFWLLFGAVHYMQNDERLSPQHFSRHKFGVLRIRITQYPRAGAKTLSFRAEVISGYHPRPAALKGHLQVSIMKTKNLAEGLNEGDELLVMSQPAPLIPPGHPGEFDYKSWLESKNIYHRIFLRQDEWVLIKKHDFSDDFSLRHLVNIFRNLREQQLKFLRNECSTAQHLAFASALILGQRGEMDRDTLQIYQGTGTMHILAVSGMHVGILYLVLNWLLGFLPASPFLQRVKVLILVGSIWSYVLLTGCSASVVRSAIMISVLISARVYARRLNSFNVLAFAAFCLLLYDPFLISDIGFQLSFLAVLGIIAIQPFLENLLKVRSPCCAMYGRPPRYRYQPNWRLFRLAFIIFTSFRFIFS